MRDDTQPAGQPSASGTSASNRDATARLPRVAGIVLILATLAVFGQICRHQFVLWDDGLHVFDNPYLHSLTLANVLAIWREPYGELYIPLTYTVWAVTAAASRGVQALARAGSPLDPAFFHALSLVVYLLNVLVVWRIVRLLLDRAAPPPGTGPSPTRVEWAAGAGALLFSVHPTHVEAVAWATGFKDVLCGFLASVAVWQYLLYVGGRVETALPDTPSPAETRPPVGRYWLATGAFGLALLAKPTAVVVPLVVWILEAWGWPPTRRHRETSGPGGPTQSVLDGLLLLVRPGLLTWLVLAVLWGWFATQVQAPESGTALPSLWARLLVAGDAVSFYLCKLVAPVWLGLDYGRTPEWVQTQWWRWLTGLAPWGLAVWLWSKRTQVPWLAAAAGVFVAGLLPVLGLVPFAFQAFSTVADRYMYLAMLGPAFALAVGLAQSRRRWLTIGCIVVLGVFGIRSAWQTHYWHDTVSLFEHELTVHPSSSVAHNALGMVLAARSRPTEATEHYTQALRFRPQYADAHNNLGNALSRQGRTQDAIREYTEALRLKPNFPEAYNNLGATLAVQGNVAEAIDSYAKALSLRPAYPTAHYNLGNALYRQGKTQEAMQQYTEAVHRQPNFPEAHNKLGGLLAGQGHIAEAIDHYTEALRLRPSDLEAHYGLGVLLAQQGQRAEARQHFVEVLRLDPGNAVARRFLDTAPP